MFRVCFLLAITAFSLCAYSQKQSITWGDEFKLRKGSNNISVVYTDAGVEIGSQPMSLVSLPLFDVLLPNGDIFFFYCGHAF